jgi:hypothetical protein
MRKILIITFLAFLSVILYCQPSLNIQPLHSPINTENVVDSFVEIEEICEDDIIANSNCPSVYLLFEEKLYGTLSPYTVKITPDIWQPPE